MIFRNLLHQPVKDYDFDVPAKIVRQILGVDSGTFQQWLARELIPFETIKRGKRTYRHFNVSHIPRLVLLSELLRNGLAISDANETVDVILGFRHKQKDEPWAVLYFRSADHTYFYDSPDELSEAFKRFDCASCIFILVEELISKVKGALALAKGAR